MTDDKNNMTIEGDKIDIGDIDVIRPSEIPDYETGNPRMVDIFLHVKDKGFTNDGDPGTFMALPFTKYDNVLGRPRVAETLQRLYGAPFVFLQSEEVLTEAEYSIYFKHII